MDRNDSRHSIPGLPVDQCFGRTIKAAFLVDVLPQLDRIEIIGTFVDINKHRMSAGLRYGFRGRDERVRNRDDDFSGRDSRRDERESESVRAATHSDTMLGIAEPVSYTHLRAHETG